MYLKCYAVKSPFVSKCSQEQNSDKLLILGMESAEQSKPSETFLPANYHCHFIDLLALKQ